MALEGENSGPALFVATVRVAERVILSVLRRNSVNID
jgi:hypothetical protein